MDYRKDWVMTKLKDAYVYIVSIAIVVFLMYFDFFENIPEYGFNKGSNITKDIFNRLLAYIFLGLLLYMFIVGKMVSNNKNIIRNLLVLLVGNLIIYTIIFFVNPNTTIENYLSDESIIYFKWYFVYSVWASFIGSKIFYDYRQEINKNGYHRYVFWKFFIQAIVFNLVLYFVFIQFINPNLKQEIFYDSLGNYMVIGLISAIFLGVFYFIDRKKNRLETEIIQQSTKAETATANFETLKNQLDPHFLFNSLNVLTGLIEENPDKAIDFTTSLSKIYRYLLEQKDKEVVPLSEEINFAKTYINLLKLRFENSVDFELDVNQFPENEFIIPLALQILLENTIKHNIVSESKPLKIRIYKEGQHLIVENSLQLKTSVKDSTGVGLNNIKNRYQLISNQRIDIQQTEENFSVKLPILSQKINIEPEDNLDYEEAKDKVKALKKFYINLFWNLLAIGISFYYLNQLKFSIIVSLFILYNIFTEWIKVNGIEENWEERKAHEYLEKKKQSKKWN